MSLFIGLLTEKNLYISSDARVSPTIPGVGLRLYDCCPKLSPLSGKLWMTGAGLMDAGAAIFSFLEEKSIKTIEQLRVIDKDIFTNIHKEVLKKFNLVYDGPEDLQKGINLLFGGMSQGEKPIMCSIDSANNFEKIFLDKPSFIVNRLGNKEVENHIQTKLTMLLEQARNIKKNQHIFILREMKGIMNYVSERNERIGPLTFFVRINKNGAKYKEFNKIRMILDGWRLKLDMKLYKRKI